MRYIVYFFSPYAATPHEPCLEFYIQGLLHYLPDLKIVDKYFDHEAIWCEVETDREDLQSNVEALEDWAPIAVRKVFPK